MRTRLFLRSTSLMASLLESDMVAVDSLSGEEGLLGVEQ